MQNLRKVLAKRLDDQYSNSPSLHSELKLCFARPDLVPPVFNFGCDFASKDRHNIDKFLFLLPVTQLVETHLLSELENCLVVVLGAQLGDDLSPHYKHLQILEGPEHPVAVDHLLVYSLLFPRKQHFMAELFQPYLDAQGLHTNAEVLVDHSGLPRPECILHFQELLQLEKPHQTFYGVVAVAHKPPPLDQGLLLLSSLDLVPDCYNPGQPSVILSKSLAFFSEFVSPLLKEK